MATRRYKFRSSDSFLEKEVIGLNEEVEGLRLVTTSVCSKVQQNERASSKNEASIKQLTRELKASHAEVERMKNTLSNEVKVAELHYKKEIRVKEIERDKAKEDRRSEVEKHKITAETERVKAQSRAKEEFYKAEQARQKAEQAKHVADAEKYQLMCRIVDGNNLSVEARHLLNLLNSFEVSRDGPELLDNGNFDCCDTLASETIPEGC